MVEPGVAERGSIVEVEGRSGEDVKAALRLLDAARLAAREHVTAFGLNLLTAMVSADIDLAPQPSLAQAKRLAVLRAQLLGNGFFTHASLAEVRGVGNVSSVRTWMTRRVGEHSLFTVKHDGRTLVPAFQFDDAGQPRPELQPLIAALATGGIAGWEAWSWLCSASSLLSGGVPEKVARDDPARAVRAAERHVTQLASLV